MPSALVGIMEVWCLRSLRGKAVNQALWAHLIAEGSE